MSFTENNTSADTKDAFCQSGKLPPSFGVKFMIYFNLLEFKLIFTDLIQLDEANKLHDKLASSL